jgi:uncharacterized oxidoreductase
MDSGAAAARDRRIAQRELHEFATRLLAAMGSEPDEAGLVAAHLVEANLRGHDSHGVSMLPSYLDGVRADTLRPNRAGRVVRQDSPFLVVDGERGHGQRVARQASERAIAMARDGGICLLLIRNAHHMGRIGSYGELVAAAGFVGIFMVNANAKVGAVAPHGGARNVLGTNPLCIAVPSRDADAPFILDMATAKIAVGKVRVARNRGARLAPDLVIDADGKPTTDPNVLFTKPAGALLPLGEHKGFGLAVAFELLAGALSGGGTQAPRNRKDGGINNHLFALIVDPARLVDPSWYRDEVSELIRHLKSTPPRDPAAPVLIAGEPERMMREERLARGIPIDSGTWQSLADAAARLGVAVPAIG